jgi:hypothetical protein
MAFNYCYRIIEKNDEKAKLHTPCFPLSERGIA